MPIPLRTDIDAVAVRAAALSSKDGAQTRRLLALAAIYEGSSRTEAGRIGGVTLQIVWDWVLKFNAAGPDGLIDQKAPGRSSLLKRPIARRWSRRSSEARYRPPTVSCAGGSSILRRCCGTTSRYRFRGRL